MKKRDKKRRRGLQKRYEHSHKTKDFDRFGVFSYPADTKFYKPKEGRNKIIIIPYEIKSKKHPLVKSGDMQVGDIDYVMDLWVHKYIGPKESNVICLKKNYGKECFLCKKAEEFRDKGKDDEYQNMKSKRRVFYNVVNANKKESGVMVFDDQSHFLFEKELIEEARSESEDGEYIDFAGIENGCIISFRGSMDAIGKNEFMKFKSFKFEEREEELDEEWLEQAVSFDEIIEIPTSEKMEALLYGSNEENSDEEDDEEKEEDDEEEEKERSKDKSKKKEHKCPSGHKYGKDCDSYDECDECDLWDECSESQGKNK